MPRLSRRAALYLALLALGAYAQVAQALLVRECLVVFYGNEVSLGAFFGSWLLWVAVGSAGTLALANRPWVQSPLPLLRQLVLALPFLLVAQVLAVRLAREALEVSSTELVPLGELFAATLAVTLPTSLTTGIVFPLACRALSQAPRGAPGPGEGAPATTVAVTTVSSLYVFEALGALLGGVLFTFVLIEWLEVWRSLGAVALLMGLVGTALSTDAPRARRAARGVALLGLAIAATPLGGALQSRMEVLRFATLEPGLELLGSAETRYGYVAVGRHDRQYSIVRDGRIAESFPAPRAAQQVAAYVYAQSGAARRVLLFGGLAEGLAEELLRYPIERLDVVMQDRRAFGLVRPYLPGATRRALGDPRLHLHFQDGRRYARHLTPARAYDLVLVHGVEPTSATGNRYFTRELYRQLRGAMSARGVLCTGVSGASNYLGREVKSYSGSVFRTLSAVFAEVAILPGDRHEYCAAASQGQVSENPRVLEERYLAVPLDVHRFPSLSFYSLLPAERVRFVRHQLTGEQVEVNTDARPVTYYLNMLLWGRLSASGFVGWLDRLRAMGPWVYVIPLAVLIALLLLRATLEGFSGPHLRRQTATLALAVLGLVAMAVQLALLFSYQAHVGRVFGRIALLNGVFMTGLALGAGAIGQRLARGARPAVTFAALLGLTAAGLALLPPLLAALGGADERWQEAAYLTLCAAAGLVTGSGFPLGVHIAQTDTANLLRTSAIAEAADHLGGALGGALTGALLVPILGVAGSCRLLAGLALLAALPVLYAQLASRPPTAILARGYRAFPAPMLSWGLAFVVVTVLVLAWSARGSAPGPTVRFDQETLVAASGSRAFTLREHPMPYYLGIDVAPAEGPAMPVADADSVSLASQPVAGEVRGYGGPINLLVSLGRDGRLRGLRYLESHETPSYIEEIDAWLDGLVEQDLARGALSLEAVDGMSGATVTSRAVLETVNRAARAAGREAFGRRFAVRPGGGETHRRWLAPRFLTLLALAIAFFPIYLSGSDRARLAYQVAVLATLGLAFNTLVTEMDLIHIARGELPSLADSPHWYVLMGLVLVTAIAFGQAYCGYVCPFGALQELVSRLGRRLYLRSYADRALETPARQLKFMLLALMLIALALTGNPQWASFNPMQHAFGAHFAGWMGGVIAVSLAGALFYYRFWCRYFCPFGALLALFNKVALLGRLAPARRFDHCDLGVRDEYDVDCIRCQRCISGRDYGVRHRPRPRSTAPGARWLDRWRSVRRGGTRIMHR